MILLVLADDFTGALDTGVQFAAQGIRTRVLTGSSKLFRTEDAVFSDKDVNRAALDAEVLVFDTESRHLPAKEAADRIRILVRWAKTMEVPYIYKKTDSALRGNVGAELSALLEESDQKQLPFLPAFPDMGRITRQGIQYIDGVEVAKSVFGEDPFEPVKHSAVEAILRESCREACRQEACGREVRGRQSGKVMCGNIVCICPLKRREEWPEHSGIIVIDAETDSELAVAGRVLMSEDRLHIMAGCAGFAGYLPQLLPFHVKKQEGIPVPDPGLCVICGSVNPITTAQMDCGEKNGFFRMKLSPGQKLEPGYWMGADGRQALDDIRSSLAEHPYVMIETNDADVQEQKTPGACTKGRKLQTAVNEATRIAAAQMGLTTEEMRVAIVRSLAEVVKGILEGGYRGTLLLTGGDTLLASMEAIGVKELEPVCELERGVVLARLTERGQTRLVITKSGGFGSEELLLRLREILRRGSGGIRIRGEQPVKGRNPDTV